MRIPVLLCALAVVLGAAESGNDRLQARLDAAARAEPLAIHGSAVLRPRGVVPLGTISIAAVNRVGSGNVPRYARFELLVTFAALTGTSPYEVRASQGGIDLQASFTSPGGEVWRIPGYFDGTDWRIRFAPDSLGVWTYSVRAVDSSGSATVSGGTFTCSASASHGWVRVDGRWLRHADGTAFCPVPHNTGWQNDVEQPSFTDLAGDAPAGSAPRLLSFWLSQPWTNGPANRRPIERVDAGKWNYDQATCSYMDGVVTRAEAAGVYLMPSIWIHDQLRVPGQPWDGGNWSEQAYSTICASASDFFQISVGGSDSQQWTRQQQFLRYLIARWGDSPAIVGWVGVVELNGTTGYVVNQTQAEGWTTAVDDWMVSNDPYRSRRGRAPITFSLSADGGGTPILDPGSLLSTRAIDSYDAKNNDLAVGAQIADECLALTDDKPVMITEFGGQVLNVTTAVSQPLHMHNGTWASLVGGAAMPAMQWCDDDGGSSAHYPMLTTAMRQHLGHLARFIGSQTWLADDSQQIAVASTGGRTADVRAWSRRIADRGMAWLQRFSGSATIAGTTIAVPCANGNYAVWWYDGWSGLESAPLGATASGGVLTLTVPVTATPRPDLSASWQRRPATVSDLSATVPAGEKLLFTLSAVAPASTITALPARGRLWQTADGLTEGAEITTVPTAVSDPLRRVIYRAPANVGPESFGFAATDARLSSNATARITVSVPPPGSTIKPIEDIPGAGSCGAGSAAGLGLLGLVGLFSRRRQR